MLFVQDPSRSLPVAGDVLWQPDQCSTRLRSPRRARCRSGGPNPVYVTVGSEWVRTSGATCRATASHSQRAYSGGGGPGTTADAERSGCSGRPNIVRGFNGAATPAAAAHHSGAWLPEENPPCLDRRAAHAFLVCCRKDRPAHCCASHHPTSASNSAQILHLASALYLSPSPPTLWQDSCDTDMKA